jgi:hypothetical protein
MAKMAKPRAFEKFCGPAPAYHQHGSLPVMAKHKPDSVSRRTGLFVIALIVLGALSNNIYELVQSIEDLQKEKQDRIETLAAKLGPAREKLQNQSQIGFITDLPPGSVRHMEIFTKTQYLLIPTLVAQSRENELVLGFFTQPREGNLTRFTQEHNLSVINDFGDGVILFSKGDS